MTIKSNRITTNMGSSACSRVQEHLCVQKHIHSVVNRIIIQRYTHLMNNIETNEVKCHVFSKNQNYHKYLTLTRIQIDKK